MHALDRKLLRDFRRLWAQALAIALVLACGIAVLVTTFGMHNALQATRAAYYAEQRFADVFAATRRAPLSLMAEIEAIPGVLAAEARVQGAAILDLPGRTQTAVGQVISLPASGENALNLPLLRAGRLPDPTEPDEVAVNEPFAKANGFVPGDTFEANLDGRKRTLTITGTMLSPEFIYTIGPGALMPDNEGFGILWMPATAAEAAFDMGGAFNFVSLSLARGADTATVIDRLDDLLEPYGGLGAYDRTEQQSNAFLDAEITQLRSTALILPPVFFGISAFLVNMVLGRIIALERSEIGLLKALGYSDVGNLHPLPPPRSPRRGDRHHHRLHRRQLAFPRHGRALRRVLRLPLPHLYRVMVGLPDRGPPRPRHRRPRRGSGRDARGAPAARRRHGAPGAAELPPHDPRPRPRGAPPLPAHHDDLPELHPLARPHRAFGPRPRARSRDPRGRQLLRRQSRT